MVLYKTGICEAPFLITTSVVALIHAYRAIQEVAHRVQTVGALSEFADVGGGRVGYLEFGVNVV